MTARCPRRCATWRAFCWTRSLVWPRRSRASTESCADARVPTTRAAAADDDPGGGGAIAAAAITAFAPPRETFSKGRDVAAWVGLTPRQHSSGGEDRLGRTSRMGRKDIRRLLILGAVAVVRGATRKGAPEGCPLGIGADPHAGAQADDAGRGGAGQPHGAHRLGPRPPARTDGAGWLTAQGRGRQGSGDDGRMRPASSGCRRGCERGAGP